MLFRSQAGHGPRPVTAAHLQQTAVHQDKVVPAPEVKDLTRTEMTELMEYIFSLSEVQRAVRHMAITHISQANRGKEQKADGNIPLHRHPDQTQ